MKRIFSLCAVAALLSPSLPGAYAERLYEVGITYLSDSVSDTISGNTYTVGLSSIGLNASYYIGETVGLFVSTSIGFPIGISATAGGITVSVDPDLYSTKYCMSMLMPIGAMVPLGPVNLLIGGGFHMSMVMLVPASYNAASSLWAVGGVGASVSALIPVGSIFSLYAGGMFAYDFFSIVGEFNELSGIEYCVTAGVSLPM
jgi:hypothetical protein